IEALISQMTIEEKVGQTTQLTLDVITQGNDEYESDEPLVLDDELVREAIVDYHVGSVLNTANNRARTTKKWNEVVSGIQTMAKEDRLQIPVIYGIDAIHGATYTAGSTLFPQEIAQAATWNRELVKKAAQITAYEVRASCIPWNFSPVLDLGKDPRWARIWETFGEDPYLVSEMGVQVINGYQGDDLSASTNVAACLKHFLGYSAATSGKDRTPGELSDIALREYHLPSFQAAIDAGAASVMINSGIINGIPVHSSHDILTKLLKEELGFTGLVVSDWADIENLHNRDKVAKSHKEAIKMGINAGIDMSMVPYDYKRYCTLLTELVNEEEVSMERLDDAVRRVLNLKYQLGLFDAQVPCPNDYPKFGSKDFEKASYEAASEAITLLKNDGNILPLKKGTRLLVTGPNANSMRTLNGGWSYSWQGEKVEEFAEGYHTILEAIQNTFGKEKVSYVPGLEYQMSGAYYEEENIDIEAAVKAAKNVDVIILCLGENSYTEKPGDLNDLTISKNQETLALALAETKKPIILVLNEGRPRIIRNIEPVSQAVVHTYLCGNFAGDALADILCGNINPSGKLPYTYPMYTNALVPYNHKPSEESVSPDGMYDYGGGFYPQYEFGFGLSYTTFEYSKINLSSSSFNADDEIMISIKVKNTGKVKGKEVIQLYSYDKYASVTPDVKRLRKFDKILLNPNEEKTVSFTINAQDLSFINAQSQRVTEAGEFELTIGSQSASISYTDYELK
nr:glycoside hydrolase family 3 C-terminal domain-containing protein [Bacteroidales bacterium]